MTAPRRSGIEMLASIEDVPRHEAQRLLLAATGWTHDQLYLGRKPSAAAIDHFAGLLERRRAGEPLQYIEGTTDFGPVTVRCDPRALIPRPETEQLWELAVAQFEDAPEVVVDVGTGTGCVALACKHAWPAAAVYGTEVSREALGLAIENVAFTGLDVTLLAGNLLGPLPARLRGAVDLVISNPPYLSQAELAELPGEVKDHEPAQALRAGASGLEVLRGLAAEAAQWLRPGGVIACEISEFRPEASRALFASYDPEIVHDLTQRPRFLIGRRRADIAA